MRTPAMLLLFIVSASNQFPCHAAPTGYLANTPGNAYIYAMNFETGQWSSRRMTGMPIHALAVSPLTGALYGTQGDRLYEIDPTTGNTLAASNSAGGLLDSLAFAPDGALYGIINTWGLVRFDFESGVVTSIGSLAQYTYIRAFAIDCEGRGIAWDDTTEALFWIDLSNAETSSIGTLTGDYDAFDYGLDGKLYSWNYNGIAWVDVENLIAPSLGTFSINSLAFAITGDTCPAIPAPSALLLCVVGTGGISWMRRHKTL